MTNNAPKIYPASSNEVLEMLGLNTADEHDPGFHAGETLAPELKEPGLDTVIKKDDDNRHQVKTVEEAATKGPLLAVNAKNLAKTILPYFLVFIVGLVMYYFFFSNTSLNLNFLTKPSVQEKVLPLTAKDTALMELQKNPEMLESYQKWISQFYFHISDASVIDPNEDNSGNGLTNFQKFLLDLNPKTYDTLGLGMADSQAISLGINPLTGGQLTAEQKDIVEKYFDLEIINNRLAVETFTKNGLVAGQNVVNGGLPGRTSIQIETARNGLKPALRTNIQNSNQMTGGSGLPVNLADNSDSLNLDTPGRLEIPALNINVPIIWTKDSKNFEKDLQLGVVHYPGTAIPGQIGTTYISGHSSNYVFARGNYNTVFSKLGDLPENSSFIITVVQKDGSDARFHYVITHRKEYSPTDQEQFRNTGESVVALSTCWPVGSTKSRLVVFGKLTQVEK